MTHRRPFGSSLGGASEAGALACAKCKHAILGGIFYCHACHIKKENKALGRAKTQIAYLSEQLKQAREVSHNKQAKINELQNTINKINNELRGTSI